MGSKRKHHKISAHFSRKDFSYTKREGGFKLRISLGLVGGLELLRSRAKNRINILKGYVDPNEVETKQFKKDYHTLGLAADITIDGLSIEDTFLLATSIPEFNGVGLNLDEQHVHVDTRKGESQYCWITENKKTIEYNEESRAKYFKQQSTPSE